jgi:hypothetical protein
MGSLAKQLEKKELKRTYKSHKASYMIKRRFHEMLISQGLNPPEGETSYAGRPYPSYQEWLKLYKPWLKQQEQDQPQQPQLELPLEDLKWEDEEDA